MSYNDGAPMLALFALRASFQMRHMTQNYIQQQAARSPLRTNSLLPGVSMHRNMQVKMHLMMLMHMHALEVTRK
jgi:hypothetical protein